MIKRISCTIFLAFGLFICVSSAWADFNEKYWEMYAEIQMPPEGQLPQLGGILIEPWQFQGLKSGILPYDIRILTDSKTEVPYQIITRAPETKVEEVAVRMINLSQTKSNETYFAGVIEKTPVIYNTIEILTGNKNFYRQVMILGSTDGQGWNVIRGDSVIFDYSREEALRHMRISFNDSNYRYLGVRIVNGNEKPLKINGMKVSYSRTDSGSEMDVGAWISKREEDNKGKESIFLIDLSYAFPVRKINLNTSDKNFQRKVDIFVKQDGGEWTRWADDMIFNFDTEKIKESKLEVIFPEVSSREIKLVIRNYDSPPLNITGVRVSGYKKMLVFKLDGRQKYYIFWGNPMARAPQYDISQIVARLDAKDMRIFYVGEQKKNPKFAGIEKRLPFTERYKYLLYGAVIIVMAGLIILQYKVIKKTDKA